jgi:hypothetical protein
MIFDASVTCVNEFLEMMVDEVEGFVLDYPPCYTKVVVLFHHQKVGIC